MILKYKELTNQILNAFYEVYNELGNGFLESVYEKAMIIMFEEKGLQAKNQESISVFFHNREVGLFIPDIIVENKVILELKAVRHILPEHEAQLINYLKATNIEVGLLLNFGEKPEFLRRVFNNERKFRIKEDVNISGKRKSHE